MNLDIFFHKAIKVCFYLLFIIVPLILTPWNYELFEFNKMLTVYALTTIIAGAWVGRMILAKKIIFKRSPFDFPLLLFLASQILSSVFSIDRHTSFFGYYSRFHGGLLSTICYLLLYWAFVTNMDRKSSVISLQSSVFTAAIVAAYGIAEHYGIDASLWVQDVRNRVFSSLGQPNWLAAYLAVLIPMTMGLALKSKVKSQKSKLLLYLCLYLLLVLCFLYTKSQSGLLGLGVSLAVFWFLMFFLNLKQKFFTQRKFFSFFFLFSFLFFIFFLRVGVTAYPQIANFFDKLGLVKPPSTQKELPSQSTAYRPPALEVGGTASSEIRKIVWKGAIEIWKHYPLLGSGVETFAYSYYNFRPKEHNLVSEWDFLYNKAHNEYLNFLATTGLVGLGAYLIFIVSFIIWSLNQFKNQKSKDDNFTFYILHFTLFSGWLSILITNFFGFSVVAIALFFFLIPAFCVVLAEPVVSPPCCEAGRQSSARLAARQVVSRQTSDLKLFQKLSLIILLITESWLLLTVLNFWRADYHYAKGQKMAEQDRYDLAFGELMKAVDLNKGEPVYRNEIANSSSYLAVYAYQQNDTATAEKLSKIALAQSEEALRVSPRSLNFWKGRVKVLFNLTQINKEILPLVIDALNEAINLAPTDPKLVYNLGVVFGSSQKKNLAVQSFEKAVELKPNYKDAHYALAVYFKEAGKKEEAKKQLEYILKNITPGDDQSLKLLEDLW